MAAGEHDFIEWLGAATSGAEALGGKAAFLDRLLNLDRVPPASCVSTAVFRQASRVDGGGPALAEAPLDGAIEAWFLLQARPSTTGPAVETAR